MMKKIYFIREKTIYYGGAEVYLTRLTNELKKLKIEFQLIHSIFPNFLPSWLRLILFNLQVTFIKGNKLYFSLERILCPDIYRAGDGVHKVFLEIVSKSKFNLLHKILLFIERRCLNNAKVIIANSKMVRQDIVKTYGIDPAKIEIIYNGFQILEKQSYQSSFSKLTKEFKIKTGQPIILFAGSGYKRKGVDEFLQILSQLNNKNFVAFIVGKEKNFRYYEKLIKDLSLENRVTIVGLRRDISDFFNICDIFLFPSHYEPFGNVVLEAMCYGSVVFTTKQTGASEIIDKEFIMSNPKDSSVIKKIDNLLNNPSLLEEKKQRNKQISLDYSVAKNCEKTLELINRHFND
ncbi:glycosyltransferase family 4 protein [Candidatus Thioglobus sp.]|nr:glycosyltransferase family 4 protein [Candidatus Thioglobus sp.]